MFNLKDLIPQVLVEMEARKSAVQAGKSEQIELFGLKRAGEVYELYNEERQELNRIFNDFEKSFVNDSTSSLTHREESRRIAL